MCVEAGGDWGGVFCAVGDGEVGGVEGLFCPVFGDRGAYAVGVLGGGYFGDCFYIAY